MIIQQRTTFIIPNTDEGLAFFDGAKAAAKRYGAVLDGYTYDTEHIYLRISNTFDSKGGQGYVENDEAPLY